MKLLFRCQWKFPDITRPEVGSPVTDGNGIVIGAVKSVEGENVTIEIDTPHALWVGFPKLPGKFGQGAFSMAAYWKEVA